MHIDIREVDADAIIEGDICIVGAGAAGLSLALEFNHTATRVILLEGGGFDYDDEVQDLYRGRTTGQPYFPLKSCRLHYFGGTTGHWGGQCTPMDEIDFVRRDWVERSGWPLRREHLDPYYERAHAVLDLGPYDYRLSAWQNGDPELGELLAPNDTIWSKLWRFVPVGRLRFGTKFRPAIMASKNISLYTYANATKVLTNKNLTRVEGVTVSNHTGKRQIVRARQYVLACCAIQNARLLLASNDRATQGLGNEHDLVGRYFMEHLELKSAELWLSDRNPLKLYQYEYGKTVARAELAVSAEKQREHAILNGTISLTPLGIARELKPMNHVWIDDDPRKSHARLAKEYATLSSRLKRSLPTGGIMEHRAYELYTRMEQAPNPNSRVTLDAECDALGVPRAALHWEFSNLEQHTLRTLYDLLARQVGAADVGRVRLMEHLQNLQDNSWRTFTAGGWHHMGTTRMSDNSREGVVNRDCRLHQVENMYVAGSSCFPTSGAANPTLTLVALCLRLADHLKQQSA